MHTRVRNRTRRQAAILLAAVTLLTSGAIAEAEKRMTVTTATSKLNVCITGESEKDTVLLIHGGPGVPDYLKDVAALLPGRNRTVRFDQRGTGASIAIGGSFRPEEYVQDIDAILQALGTERVHLFGHSWGGLLAQIYAAYRPDRVKSLFLASPSSGTGKVWAEMEKEVMAYNKKKATGTQWLGVGLNSFLGMLGSDRAYQRMFMQIWSYYFLDPRTAPAADEGWLEGIRALAVNGTRRGILDFDNRAWEARLSGLNVPVLVTYGAYDIYGESRRYTFERWPAAKQVRMEHAGHLPWIQDQKAFVELLREFYGN